MIVEEQEFRLKDGRIALLRSPRVSEAAEMLRFIIRASGETDFLLRYPEDFDGFSVEKEAGYLLRQTTDENCAMITCCVDGKIVGNCQIVFKTGLKVRHRASVGITVLKEYWGLGIGTAMFEKLFGIARARGGVRQIELEFIEGNARARGLYEKTGFRIAGIKPDAVRLKDGRFFNVYFMIKTLEDREDPGK